MRPVKWIRKDTRLYPAVVDQANYIPVIPLAALREVVEGLRYIAHLSTFTNQGIPEITKSLLASLGEQ